MLNDIIANKKLEITQLPDIAEDSLAQCHLDFYRAIFNKPLAIIAEMKAATPSAGILTHHYDPVSRAQDYVAAGANALSILTDKKYFQGSYEDIAKVKAHYECPILCKEFIINEKQIKYARSVGADACLLIVSILTDQQLQDLKNRIESYNMTAVIEVFNKNDLQRALLLAPKVVQINNRNLYNMDIDINNSKNLCEQIPQPIAVISASGISKPEEILNLPPRINAVLIGTALMRSSQPKDFLKAMRTLL